eukprot:6009137-Prymnesium_polylepis.3
MVTPHDTPQGAVGSPSHKARDKTPRMERAPDRRSVSSTECWLGKRKQGRTGSRRPHPHAFEPARRDSQKDRLKSTTRRKALQQEFDGCLRGAMGKGPTQTSEEGTADPTRPRRCGGARDTRGI